MRVRRQVIILVTNFCECKARIFAVVSVSNEDSWTKCSNLYPWAIVIVRI